MFKKTALATTIAMLCYHSSALAEQSQPEANANQLGEITVVASDDNESLVSTQVSAKTIQQKQARDIKDVLADQLDVGVTALPSSRSGNDGVNLRGLSGNRVATSIDGIPLPEAQEAKHFISYGMEFGRGDYVETSALRSADIQYVGSANSLSGSVDFRTLEPADLLKGRQVGGFAASGYNSVDNSVYGSVGGALELDRYQGMVMTTLRGGDQTKNHGDNASVGSTRTEADPAQYKNIYVLTKQQYQVNDNNSLKFAYEYQRKETNTDLLSKNGVSIDRGTGTQVYGSANDYVSRYRFSLGHEYSNSTGWLQNAKTQLYYQNASTENQRLRQSLRNFRTENSQVRNKTYGLTLDLRSDFEASIAHSLRYGVGLNRTDASNYLTYLRPAYSAVAYQGKPSADTKQTKINGYVEDQISLGNFVLTPHLGFVHYRMSPKQDGNSITGFTAEKNNQTLFTPKFGASWKIAPEFEPYFQYSRGVRTPSPQQLTSFFNEIVPIPRGVINVAVVGNPNLKSETAHNFELGFKGKNDKFSYVVTGYYNRYKNFIDWQDITSTLQGYTQFLQYQNLDKAKIYGVTANAKWSFYNDFYALAGVAYAKGKANNDGVKTPINSVQPLKTRLGLGYEGEKFGTNLQWSYVRGKSDKDINGSLYNPTGGYSVFDLGIYWKPVKDLTLNANLNNMFNKKYWNWNDISYLALLKGETNTANNPPIGIDANNADRYTAPGRNFNVGLRYEF